MAISNRPLFLQDTQLFPATLASCPFPTSLCAWRRRQAAKRSRKSSVIRLAVLKIADGLRPRLLPAARFPACARGPGSGLFIQGHPVHPVHFISRRKLLFTYFSSRVSLQACPRQMKYLWRLNCQTNSGSPEGVKLQSISSGKVTGSMGPLHIPALSQRGEGVFTYLVRNAQDMVYVLFLVFPAVSRQFSRIRKSKIAGIRSVKILIQCHFFRSYPPACAARQLMAAVRSGGRKRAAFSPLSFLSPQYAINTSKVPSRGKAW